jgi:hypothetical protein
MKTVMFSFMNNSPGTIIPSTRIARYVQEKLKLPVYWNDPAIKDEKPDVLMIVNGAYAFCKCLEELASTIAAAKRIVWIQNDYTIVPPIANGKAESPFRRAFVDRHRAGRSHLEFWTTCEVFARKTPLSTYVNWNALTWEPRPEAEIKKERAVAKPDLFYYGSYRHASGSASRVKYFDRFLSTRKIPVTISSPSHGDNPNPKFVDRFPHATHTGKFKTGLLDELARHGAGLYIEDIMSHREFHSPANRFYEMVSAGLPVIFQIESVRMLEKAGIHVGEWAALTEEKMVQLFNDRDTIGRAQQKAFRKIDHAGALEKQFADAWEKLRRGL